MMLWATFCNFVALKGNCIDFQLELILKYYMKERSLQSVNVQYSFVRKKSSVQVLLMIVQSLLYHRE